MATNMPTSSSNPIGAKTGPVAPEGAPAPSAATKAAIEEAFYADTIKGGAPPGSNPPTKVYIKANGDYDKIDFSQWGPTDEERARQDKHI